MRIYGRSAINDPMPGCGQEANVLTQAVLRTNAGSPVANHVALVSEKPTKKTTTALARAVRDAVQEA
eukprot:3379400-Lingulodinium_polyedra.AAC.1